MRRRGKLSVNGQSTISSAIGDDTIELQLTPEQWRELAQAAELAQPVAPAQISAVAAPGRVSAASSSPQPLIKVGPRASFTIGAKMVGATIAYVAFAWWSAAQLAGQPQPPATAAARPTAVIPRPALIATASNPGVRVINPFDATEVFEFPAGTSRAESHEKVAQILMQRARERQSQWERIRPVGSLRTASLYRPP
jgi:hypothetical protein